MTERSPCCARVSSLQLTCRIKAGHFSLDGVLYNLTVNNNGNTLHGGLSGWDKRNWRASIQDGSVVFSLISEDGDEGFMHKALSLDDDDDDADATESGMATAAAATATATATVD